MLNSVKCLYSIIVVYFLCQEREAALDAIMDRIRQEATEAGLKDGLKKALQLLDTIRARYVQVEIGSCVKLNTYLC